MKGGKSMSATRFNQIKAEIEEMKDKLAHCDLSEEQKQILSDQISDKKRELEKESLGEHKIVPVVAPIVGDKKVKRNSDISNFFYI